MTIPGSEEVANAFDAAGYVGELISNPGHPLVLMGTDCCESCWAVIKLLQLMQVDFHHLDLAAEEFQQLGEGRKIRIALQAISGCSTLPQIFLNGKFIGGATDLFGMYQNGRLQNSLQLAGICFVAPPDLDPYALLAQTHFNL